MTDIVSPSGTTGVRHKDMGDGSHAEVVTVGPRKIIDQRTITAPATTGVTLASLCAGAVIPANAVVAEIQAIGGAVRIGLKNGTTVTPTTGYKIDTGAEKTIDTVLADVTIVAESTAALCNVTFYDRV